MSEVGYTFEGIINFQGSGTMFHLLPVTYDMLLPLSWLLALSLCGHLTKSVTMQNDPCMTPLFCCLESS